MSLILAYDPGFGNTKVASDQGVHILQLAVAHPGGLGQGTSDLQVMEGNLRPLTADLQVTRF
jgi:hypothetical protein